jgi:hypothetical protein
VDGRNNQSSSSGCRQGTKTMNGVCDIELLSQPQPAISTAAVLLVSPRGTVPRGEISPFAARG